MLLNLRWPILFLVLLGAIVALAAKEYVAPRANPANSYPAHDAHSNEGVTIAADPYDQAEKAAAIFTVPFEDAGFLPIFLVISNDNDEPVSLTNLHVELVTANKSKVQPAISDDIQRRFRRGGPRTGEPPKPRLPIPGTRVPKPPKSESRDAVEEFNQASFVAKAVEPHGNQAGFLFFDVTDISRPLAGAHLYVSGVRNAKGQDLMFFDIPLDDYLNRPK